MVSDIAIFSGLAARCRLGSWPGSGKSDRKTATLAMMHLTLHPISRVARNLKEGKGQSIFARRWGRAHSRYTYRRDSWVRHEENMYAQWNWLHWLLKALLEQELVSYIYMNTGIPGTPEHRQCTVICCNLWQQMSPARSEGVLVVWPHHYSNTSLLGRCSTIWKRARDEPSRCLPISKLTLMAKNESCFLFVSLTTILC
jgi:hypothetical protein